jgi:hypothetical protein
MMRIEHRMHLAKIKPFDSKYSALFHIEQDNCDIDEQEF